MKSGKAIHPVYLQQIETQPNVELFSMQILFDDAKFTAADFFTLNRTVVFSIIGGIFTYLIILIQFTNEHSVCNFFNDIS